jgi:hypothetical protein
MEAWRQWLLGKENNNVPQSQNRSDLTPTGLLMEGDYTQNRAASRRQLGVVANDTELVFAEAMELTRDDTPFPHEVSQDDISCAYDATARATLTIFQECETLAR